MSVCKMRPADFRFCMCRLVRKSPYITFQEKSRNVPNGLLRVLFGLLRPAPFPGKGLSAQGSLLEGLLEESEETDPVALRGG